MQQSHSNYNIKELQKFIVNNSGNNLLVPVLLSQELLFENRVILNDSTVAFSEAGASFDYSNLKFCEYKIKY